MSGNWPDKDFDEKLDYDMNWAKELGSDTITESTWEVVQGTVTLSDDSYTSNRTKVWADGGAPGEAVKLTNRIVTAGGRHEKASGKFDIRPQ